MGAVGVHRTMDRFRDRGFEPIELERNCGSNKIWTTKVKRLRLPDLLCVKTGMRAEVRAKTDLKIRMSDAPANPDRVWDAGLRDDDIVAVITCFDRDEGPEPADDAVYFTVGALRASADRSKLGPPKSASEVLNGTGHGPPQSRPASRTGGVRSPPCHWFRRGIAGSRHGRQCQTARSGLDCCHTRPLAAGPGTGGPPRLSAARSDCSHVAHCPGCTLACFRNHRYRYCLSPETESLLTPENLPPSGQI